MKKGFMCYVLRVMVFVVIPSENNHKSYYFSWICRGDSYMDPPGLQEKFLGEQKSDAFIYPALFIELLLMALMEFRAHVPYHECGLGGL